MKQIITGSNFEKVVQKLKLNAKQTYKSKTETDYNVWDISDVEFDEISKMSDEEWDKNFIDIRRYQEN